MYLLFIRPTAPQLNTASISTGRSAVGECTDSQFHNLLGGSKLFFMLGKRPERSQSKLTRRAQSKCNREELTCSGRTDGRRDQVQTHGKDKREREKIMLAKTSEI